MGPGGGGGEGGGGGGGGPSAFPPKLFGNVPFSSTSPINVPFLNILN